MDITNELRLICGHDSYDVDGCVTCEAATLIESLRQQLASRDAEVAELNAEIERKMSAAEFVLKERDQLREQVTLLRSLVPKRIPDGFVSFGKYYSEQEDKFNEPYNSMCKFKRKYLSDCEEALAATEPK